MNKNKNICEAVIKFGEFFGLLFVCIEVNIPVNNFSVMLGQSYRFLGVNQCTGELICLAQGHNMVPPVGIIPRTSLCSDALPLHHNAPRTFVIQRTTSFELYHEKIGFLAHLSR